MLVLPEFRLLHRQPKMPNRAPVIARIEVPNEYGTQITYTVWEHRGSWWIAASLDGMRMSDTLHTSVPAKGKSWVRAVQTGRVSVGENKTKAQIARELDEALAKLKERNRRRSP